MKSIRFETTVDDAMAGAIPPLRPLLGRRVEMIATDTNGGAHHGGKLTVGELLARRIDAPAERQPLTQADIERAILLPAR